MKTHPIYQKALRGEYIAPKDLASLVRTALNAKWPAAKFSVTTKQGTGSINVRWQDGPTYADVNATAGHFETKGFDGMIDLAHSYSLWIYPDGSAHVAHGAGTEGSMGSAPEVIEDPVRPDAVFLEDVASCFVFCQRSVTPRAFRRAIAEYRAQNWIGCENVEWDAIEIRVSDYDGSGYLYNVPNIQPGNGYRWLQDELCRLAHSYDLTAPEPAPEPAPIAVITHTPCLCW